VDITGYEMRLMLWTLRYYVIRTISVMCICMQGPF